MCWILIIRRSAMVMALLMGLMAYTASTQEPTPLPLICDIGWTQAATLDLSGFRLYTSRASGGQVKGQGYVKEIPSAPNPAARNYYARCTEFGITHQGTYYLKVTAVDMAGNESDFSNELKLESKDLPPPPPPDTLPPGAPVNLRAPSITVGTVPPAP